MMDFDLEERVELAGRLFKDGYNCCQSVVLAYYDILGLDKQTATAISSGFGGGMGRLREVCGSVSGMVILAGMLSPADDPSNKEGRTRNYALVQEVAEEFRKENGSIVCKELLGLAQKAKESPVPSDRTEEYYKKRPCQELVKISARIIGQKIKSSKELCNPEQRS